MLGCWFTALPGCTNDDGDTSAPATTPALTSSESDTDGTSGASEPTTDASEPTTGDLQPSCGNGEKDPGEACDDGNVDNTDFCLEGCVLAFCGDAFVQAGLEQCDDGNTANEDSCVTGCYLATCGDGHTYAGVEDCDDGNKQSGDGCDADCKMESDLCGNSVVEGQEACDDGNADNTDICLDNCKTNVCGDGWQHAVFEECDDGNPDDSDDCVNKDGKCLLASCGDGFLFDGEEDCDDGNLDDSDDCPGTCQPASCGDGFLYAGVELCDDGENVGAYDGCNAGCLELGPRCGDGNLDGDVETCDDGNLDLGDGCDAACKIELPTECLGYIELKEADRASSFNDGQGKVNKCDKTTDDKWHRFLPPAGLVMPLKAPTQYSCGTEAPGWMVGEYPVFDDGVVPRQVCFAWFGEPCFWSTDIHVRNCGEYFVFQLPNPPECSLRYCASPLPP